MFECFKGFAGRAADQIANRRTLPIIISPASGIRRPSYNGAPAWASTLCFQISKAMTGALLLCYSSALASRPHFEKFNYDALQRARARLPAPLKARKAEARGQRLEVSKYFF